MDADGVYGKLGRCLACGGRIGPGEGPALCRRCPFAPVVTPPRDLEGLAVAYGAVHRGGARGLVHRLKYEGVVAAARPLAVAMAANLPWRGTLVPVPRVRARAWSTGVDPAAVLADEVARRLGLPVVRALVAPVWRPRRAGRLHRGAPPRLRLVRPVSAPILVDDVVTTGATLRHAARLSQAGHAVVATAAPQVTSLRPVQWDVPPR